MLSYMALSFPVTYYFINVRLNKKNSVMFFIIWIALSVGMSAMFILILFGKKEQVRRNDTISNTSHATAYSNSPESVENIWTVPSLSLVDNQTSLPSYDNVVCQETWETEENPPPSYNEAIKSYYTQFQRPKPDKVESIKSGVVSRLNTLV